ncbi:MAG: dihydroneopterin aldolase [Terrimicrobiaceae bacterium]|nr:dihydroneopterin aldolase [Terrimicrobiaceae bacterium]
MNEIVIRGLRLSAHVGVPDEERAEAQELQVDLVIEPVTGFEDLGEEIGRTVDYDRLSRRVAAVAGERPRKLIETLAVDIAEATLAEFPAASVTVEIRKFILPATDHVAVRFRATRPPH